MNTPELVGMNILMVTPYFFPERGGLENYAYNIAKRLVKKGWNITVVCSTRENKNGGVTIDNIKILRLKPNFILSNTPIKFSLFSEILNRLRSGNFDLINAHTPVPYFADVSAMVSKLCNDIPFVLTYHNDLIKDSFLMNVVAKMYNFTINLNTLSLAKKIITPSPFCYNESRFLQKFKDKLVWIPPGVDIEKYSTKESKRLHELYDLPESSKVVLFVGAMNRGHTHKGVHYLLRAFKKVLEKINDVYLVLVGKGDMIPEYQSMCVELKIFDRVVFTGFVEESDLIRFYQSSDVVVLPSTTVQEGFGMVLIEAGACGKPVIGTRVGGMKYVIKDGETGLLVPPKDEMALAKAIVKLLQDEDMAKKMGINGRKLVEEKYTWNRSIRLTEDVYTNVALKGEFT